MSTGAKQHINCMIFIFIIFIIILNASKSECTFIHLLLI